MVLPDFVTNMLQGVYYGIRYKGVAGEMPKSGTERFKKHRNRIYTLVVLAYLFVCSCNVIYSRPQSYYAELGMHVSSTKEEMREKFLQYVKKNHAQMNDKDHEDRFVRVRHMTLYRDFSKEIYDKFGEIPKKSFAIFSDALWFKFRNYA